jgi:8-oxo-dGTP diphosphatase
MIEVVAGACVRIDRWLVGLRSASGDYPNVWEFPGGKVEKGEIDIVALRREVREELKVECLINQQLYKHQFNGAYSTPLFTVATYEVTLLGEPRLTVHQKLRWVTTAQLHQLSCAPSLERALKEGHHG